MQISLGGHKDFIIFLDTDDNTIGAVSEFAVLTTQICEHAREALGDNCPPLTEAFKRYDSIVEALAKHELTIDIVVKNMAQISSHEAEAVQAEVIERMNNNDFMQITDNAVVIPTRFGYVLGASLPE